MSPFGFGNISYEATTRKFPLFGNILYDAIRPLDNKLYANLITAILRVYTNRPSKYA